MGEGIELKFLKTVHQHGRILLSKRRKTNAKESVCLPHPCFLAMLQTNKNRLRINKKLNKKTTNYLLNGRKTFFISFLKFEIIKMCIYVEYKKFMDSVIKNKTQEMLFFSKFYINKRIKNSNNLN